MTVDSPRALAEINAAANNMLNDAQRLIDDALELAALIVGVEEHGHYPAKGIDQGRITNLARGIVNSRSFVGLASYLTDSAMKDGTPTRADLLRSVSGYFDAAPTVAGD